MPPSVKFPLIAVLLAIVVFVPHAAYFFAGGMVGAIVIFLEENYFVRTHDVDG